MLLNTDDEVFVIDPENEYAGLAKMFYGSSIRIAPGSGVHINPMDMSLDYSPEDGDDPIVMKSDFIASICEAATGTRYPLTPIQKSVIDRCVKNVYKDYMDTLRAEGKSKDEAIVPTLFDLYKEIDMQILRSEPEDGTHHSITMYVFPSYSYQSFYSRYYQGKPEGQ